MSKAKCKKHASNKTGLPEGFQFVVGYEDGTQLLLPTKKAIEEKQLFHKVKIPALNEAKSLAAYLALEQIDTGKKLILQRGNIKCAGCQKGIVCDHIYFRFPNTLVAMLDGADEEMLKQLNDDSK
jgi:hypothetical protein